MGATPGLLSLRIRMKGLPADMRYEDDDMLHFVSDAASNSLQRALKGLPALQASMLLAKDAFRWIVSSCSACCIACKPSCSPSSQAAIAGWKGWQRSGQSRDLCVPPCSLCRSWS